MHHATGQTRFVSLAEIILSNRREITLRIIREGGRGGNNCCNTSPRKSSRNDCCDIHRCIEPSFGKNFQRWRRKPSRNTRARIIFLFRFDPCSFFSLLSFLPPRREYRAWLWAVVTVARYYLARAAILRSGIGEISSIASRPCEIR